MGSPKYIKDRGEDLQSVCNKETVRETGEAGGARSTSVKKDGKARVLTAFPLLLGGLSLFLVISVTAAVMLGSVRIEPVTVWKIALSHMPGIGSLIERDWTKAQEQIIWNIRFPRVLLGLVVGAGLSAVGVTIQALIRNSLGDPYILGVSSGSSVAATLVLLFGGFSFLGAYALPVSAFIGSLVAMALVFTFAKVGGRISTTRLLLAGTAVASMMSAFTSFIVTMAPNAQGIRSVVYWLMGSLAGAKWEYLTAPALIVVSGILFLLFQHRSLNALLVGEGAAGTMGVNVPAFRTCLVIVTALITGTIVSVSGSIGFVGLMIPHIVRLVLGSDHRKVLPVSVLFGAVYVIWADVLARLALAPEELPIGIVTAICGGPFFIWLLRRSSYAFGGTSK
ncbi:FecCD family ABC transporter permease [Paenibacillus chitinolyticus]|uniref:FecCD family ABC transporter permease n=1 Tax=Paenibacillus chitinolyticus TaxID=79263 RepID=UPI003CFECAE4